MSASLINPGTSQIVGFGYFDKRGTARVRFSINGVKLTAIMDTGFTGFVSLPLQIAEDLGLRPIGYALAVMANGSIAPHVVTGVHLRFAGRTHKGYGLVAKGSRTCIVGMDFLKRFHLSLIVAKNAVILVDDKWITPARKRNALR